MNNLVIHKKLESLTNCLRRIEKKRPGTIEELLSDYDLQDIISLNLSRAVQISVDIGAILIAEYDLKTSSTMSGTFAVLKDAGILNNVLAQKLQKAVGFRNISVHEYESIDWEIVFDIIHNHLGNFKEYIKAVINRPITGS